ncbi:hypothetical protein [Duganella sp. S19_KUP01_CR8]|uniref:hypothetical protein n=1 Tax=Duganella sp. S19_KUP01_CR8 TaxID=3025502 RepID=UPI002FCD7471
MNIFRLVLVLATLSLASQANAELHQYTFKSVLVPDNAVNATRVYPDGTTITGKFQLDDSLSSTDYTNSRYTYGAFSGSILIGNNAIKFADSLVYVTNNYANITEVVMLGGGRWNTGGSISETQAPAGYAIEGLQLSFDFQRAAIDTPIDRLFSSQTPISSSLYLDYGLSNGMFYGNWGSVTEIKPLSPIPAVPEPNMALLIGIGFLCLLVAKRRAARET